jgi:glycosyltransferase involved in cell wall biosynthesis
MDPEPNRASSSGMPLRILIVHNRYRLSGGEDTVVATETALLRSFGHEVEEYYEANDSPFGVGDFPNAIWSFHTTQRLQSVLRRFQPSVVHCHNLYYRITPSVYWLCYWLGIPVVQTLHNFRYGCVNARLSREGEPCELCLSKWGRIYGVLHACFQESYLRSAALGISNELHEVLGSFTVPVSKFISLSHYACSKHVLAGIPKRKLVVKPNCVYPDPGVKEQGGSFCLFVGRLESDKGVQVLLRAASLIPHIPIMIAGEGPLEGEVRQAASTLRNLRYLGPVSHTQVLDLMKAARFLAFPSLAYENFPMTIGEAFSVGLPVVASRRGAAEEIVQDSVNGFHFKPGSPASLASSLRGVWEETDTLARMGAAARVSFEQQYSGECTSRKLCAIYREVIGDSAFGRRA